VNGGPPFEAEWLPKEKKGGRVGQTGALGAEGRGETVPGEGGSRIFPDRYYPVKPGGRDTAWLTSWCNWTRCGQFPWAQSCSSP
jgi:hypothetical protein